jgi:hypothetical protein
MILAKVEYQERTQIINELLRADAAKNKARVIEILNEQKEVLLSEINLLLDFVCYYGLLDYLKSIIITELNEDQINLCARSAAEGGHVDVLDFVLAEAQRRGIKIITRSIYEKATRKGHLHILWHLARRPHGLSAPTQVDIKDAFFNACDKNHKHILMYLLNPINNLPLPSGFDFDYVFGVAAQHDRSTIMYLLNESDKIGLPTQIGANQAVYFALRYRSFNTLRYILKQPKGIPLPGQDTIDDSYKEIIKNKFWIHNVYNPSIDVFMNPEDRAEAISILRPYVSPEVVRQYEPDFIPPQQKKKFILAGLQWDSKQPGSTTPKKNTFVLAGLQWDSNQPVAVR